MLQLSVPTTPDVTQTTALDGSRYNFKFKYNTRQDRYYLSIYDGADLIIGSVLLNENQILLGGYLFDNFPDSRLMCLRNKGSKDIRATMGTIGIDREYELIYVPVEELREIVDG